VRIGIAGVVGIAIIGAVIQSSELGLRARAKAAADWRLCPECVYPVAGDEGICPECGREHSLESLKREWTEA